VDQTFSKVHIRFGTVAAKINFDPANLEENRFFFEIKVDSINTGISKRDKDLLSPDWFEGVKYPLITFESKTINDK
jgi:polyisoprenoid-binding protein YceI